VNYEQELFWKILQNDPATRVHRLGQELARIKDEVDEVNSRTDEFLAEQMDSDVKPEELVRIFVTLLQTYSLPIRPSSLSSFTRFSSKCAKIITDDAARKPDKRLLPYPDPARSSKVSA